MSSSRPPEPDSPDFFSGSATPSAAATVPTRRRSPRVRPLSAWTLRSKLVASTIALIAFITLVAGAGTVIALRGYLYGQLDQQLSGSIQGPRFVGSDSCTSGRFRGPGDEGLVAYQSDSGSLLQGCATVDRTRTALTATELDTIFSYGALNHPTTVYIDGLGSYRLVAAQAPVTDAASGDTVGQATVVAGLPTDGVDRTIGRMVAVGIAGVIGGVVLAALLGTVIVRRSLRPLDRMAATATRVSHLPLDRGQVALAERVPTADTDQHTEVGQVGAALNEMLEHIDEALQSRQQSEERVRQFVADASHELRTPLASIRGYAELTKKERDPVPPTVSHAIGRIESEGKRMSSLVEDLLLLARLDAGRPLERDTVDLTEMVVNAVSDAHAASPDHSWRLDLPDEPVEVHGDGARLHQIIANLLANARTHTDPGTVVRTSLNQESGRVRISVQDNGPGVPKDLQANVFQRFARGDTSRNRAGGSTGLGLSIVAAVAQAHGGSVELESQPGDTRFSVLLPA